MAQFDVYPNTRRSGRRAPYLLDVQSDLLEVSTRLVAPLIRQDYLPTAIDRLTPCFTVASQALVLSPTELTAVRKQDLPTAIDALSSHRNEIVAALDMLFTGI